MYDATHQLQEKMRNAFRLLCNRN